MSFHGGGHAAVKSGDQIGLGVQSHQFVPLVDDGKLVDATFSQQSGEFGQMLPVAGAVMIWPTTSGLWEVMVGVCLISSRNLPLQAAKLLGAGMAKMERPTARYADTQICGT